jgi:DNA-binding NtrC family response regulator
VYAGMPNSQMAGSKASRILVVEDQTVPRKVLAQILSRNGFEVQSAANAKEALDVGVHFQPDLLLTDWLLPGNTNGLQVAEAMRATRPELSVIFLTGLPTDKLAAQAQHVQPCKFIEKPCDFDELLREIRQMALKSD